MARVVVTWLLAAASLAAAPARAQVAPPEPAVDLEITEGVRFTMPCDYRFRVGHLSDYPDDARGQQSPEDLWGEHRLRIEPTLAFGTRATLRSQLDVLDGFLWSRHPDERAHQTYRDVDRTDLEGADLDQFRVRQLWADVDLTAARLRAGRQGSRWGLGILANPGDGYENDWGDARAGDIVDRVLVATNPLAVLAGGASDVSWLVALAYDLVVDDDFSNNVEPLDFDPWGVFGGTQGEDDDVQQAIASTLYRSDRLDLGAYAVWREAEEGRNPITGAPVPASRNTTRAWVVDLYGRAAVPLGDASRLFVEGEVAYVTGETQLNIANDRPDPPATSEVDQLGFAARGGFRSTALDLEVETGFASGDDNPFDDEQRAFRFDRAFNPSLILFEEVLDSQSATSVFNLSDPALVGFPPENVDAFSYQGSVLGAVYLKGTVRYRPVASLVLKAAALHAQLEEAPADPFNMSAFTGGARAGFLGGGSGAKDLGWEVDLGGDWTLDVEPVRLVLGLQGGVLFGGAAFEDAAGRRMNDVLTVQARANVMW